MLNCRSEPGGDEQRSYFVSVQADGMGFVIDPGSMDVDCRGVSDKVFLLGIAVEAGHGAQSATDGGRCPTPEEVTLTVEAEFKVLGGTSLNGIPVISNRSLKSDVTLKMGEWAVVAGLIDDEDARTIAGIAGLAGIPVIGPLTRSTTRNTSADQVLILLRPTLLTQPPDNSLTHVFRMGAEMRPLTPL